MDGVLLAMLSAALITIVLGPVIIPLLRRLKFGQHIRTDGPQAHLQKSGTPTMGGIMFLVSIAVVPLVFWDKSTEVVVLVFITLLYGLIGFSDDFIKIVKKRSLGLRAKQKLAAQTIGAIILAYIAVYQLGLGTSVAIPFTNWRPELGFPLYLIFAIIVMLGASNAVNLTDGLDGLAAGITVITGATYAIIAGWQGQAGMAIFGAAVAGGCLGFLWYNFYPAKVFMGDTGSLALGGALGSLAILTKTELLLPIIGGVYVAEALSVIIQVAFFKKTGRRVFRMSPLHHHFELGGWKETKVVTVFWLAAIICSLVGLFGVYRMG